MVVVATVVVGVVVVGFVVVVVVDFVEVDDVVVDLSVVDFAEYVAVLFTSIKFDVVDIFIFSTAVSKDVSLVDDSGPGCCVKSRWERWRYVVLIKALSIFVS